MGWSDDLESVWESQEAALGSGINMKTFSVNGYLIFKFDIQTYTKKRTIKFPAIRSCKNDGT